MSKTVEERHKKLEDYARRQSSRRHKVVVSLSDEELELLDLVCARHAVDGRQAMIRAMIEWVAEESRREE